ncbi:MAG: glycosyltransferase family 2 protein [Candidatus Bathyarchaeia archaeon]
MSKKTLISLIMPIHNEEEYLPKSLKSLKKIEDQIFEFIFILDRCTDNSENIVRQWFPNAKIIRKTSTKWKNSLAENFQIGLAASKGNIICTQDADTTAPANLRPLLDKLKENVASVSPMVVTYKNASFLNRVYYWWEKTRKFAPLGEEPRGAFRLIRRECLEQVGGFKDAIAQETQLDIDLRRAGYQSIMVKDVSCYHLRKFSFKKAIKSQIRAGIMRRQLHIPFWRVLGHSILRLRPFVIIGYLFIKENS